MGNGPKPERKKHPGVNRSASLGIEAPHVPTAVKGSRVPDITRWVAVLLKSAFQRRPDIKQLTKPPLHELTGRALKSALRETP